MQRELYEVEKDRFDLKDSSLYHLQGTWPKDHKPEAVLDGEKLPAAISAQERVSALERFKDLDLVNGERVQMEICLPDLEGKGVFGKTYPEGTGCRSLQLLRFLFSKPAMAGLLQQCCELPGGYSKQILWGRVLGEDLFGGDSEGVREQRVVLRKHLIQQRNDPALTIPTGIHQSQPVPAQLPQCHDGLL